MSGGVVEEGMREEPTRVTVRKADLSGPDRAHVARLVEAYLRQTEHEKAEHLTHVPPAVDQLPASYRGEVEHPEEAFADASVFLAELNGAAVGVGVVKHHPEVSEIKRLWAEPQARGWGIGSALLDALLLEAPNAASLTVWHWRTQARDLYLSRGFSVVPSWERRSDLICMRRSGTGGSREF